MIRVRARKIAGIIREIPPLEVFGPPEGELLVVGWGSTYGSITQAVRELQAAGHAVAQVQPPALNPSRPTWAASSGATGTSWCPR